MARKNKSLYVWVKGEECWKTEINLAPGLSLKLIVCDGGTDVQVNSSSVVNPFFAFAWQDSGDFMPLTYKEKKPPSDKDVIKFLDAFHKHIVEKVRRKLLAVKHSMMNLNVLLTVMTETETHISLTKET